MNIDSTRRLALAWCAALAVPAALAHGEAHKRHGTAPVVKEQKPWGIAGEARGARTIEIRMSDQMRFTPDRLTVREGETIRFVVRNNGRLLHEMVIGTPEELAAHAELMKKHPGMEHDEPYMAHVAAGQRGQLVWHFNRPGTFQFACLLPGHFEAGMVGTVVVTPASQEKKP
ncbi:plastocyanin/azurin family copper-binding protein [Ramlibacter sp.]|uniref:cupredoxin domain-containing protein n=1 Tax=Ramlibacter sp. TaxID=1917967 RepID=UPI0035B2A506